MYFSHVSRRFRCFDFGVLILSAGLGAVLSLRRRMNDTSSSMDMEQPKAQLLSDADQAEDRSGQKHVFEILCSDSVKLQRTAANILKLQYAIHYEICTRRSRSKARRCGTGVTPTPAEIPSLVILIVVPVTVLR
jgi:hypothetical protein